ncbi:MAG: hypothetical protein IPF99_31065 [Deltaproteobacteria bacterium]|nr:hypothetical protein [Deltaproteobacteria bacterium]
MTDATLRCWGRNSSGQLGDGTNGTRRSPTVVAGLGGVAEVTLGDAHTCARLNSGELRCWGDNESGQLGDGTTTDRRVPTTVVF